MLKGVIAMNSEKWTEAMQEAFGRAAQSALSLNQQIVDVEHLMYALLEDVFSIECLQNSIFLYQKYRIYSMLR